MFRINSENELLQLLKIVSEEAVKKSRKTLNEAVDVAQERYINNLRASENTYGVGLTEQEGAAEEEAEEPVETETEEPVETETEVPAEEDQKPETIDPATFGGSFDSVIKDLNSLRAGRSTKDKDIKDQLLGYYDKLDDGERKVLHLFLRQLSSILQGALTAADAQDPSDSPFNAEITFPEEDETTPEAEVEPEGGDAPEEGEESASGEGEDTSPPIKVNERQDLQEIRKRVKRLMKRF